MENPLYIPPQKKWKGLTVYCYKCNTNVSEKCNEIDKPIQKCPFGDKHAFKVYVHVAGSGNQRKTKKLDTRDLNEAIQQAIQFEKEVKANRFSLPSALNNNVEKTKKENTPILLVNSLARYIGFLSNEGVPIHRKKERSQGHIKDLERAFQLLVNCLKKYGHDMKWFSIDQVNDEIVGQVYEFLKNEKHFSNRSINKHLSYYTSFFKWYSDEFNPSLKNWFEKAPRKRIQPNPEIIYKEEFDAMLKRITPENGKKKYTKGVKPFRSLYRPWLADGFKLALETGRRREEISNLKYNNILTDRHAHSYIKVEDYKVNRIQQRLDEGEKKYIFIPVTESLQKLLMELGYEKYKGTDNFILAPEIKISRSRVMSDILSRGFSHYFNQISDRELSFKSLRKTYITNLSLFMGGNASAVTGHSDDAVIEKYYSNKEAVAIAARGFKVFSDEPQRKNELEMLRENQNHNVNQIEIDQ